jgi:hypothetical protein
MRVARGRQGFGGGDMIEESIFICDPAPGLLRVLSINGSATHEMVGGVNEALEKAGREGRRFVVFPRGSYCSFVFSQDYGEWPDAEFCAA